MTTAVHSEDLAQRVRAALHQASSLAGHSVTVSAGVAEMRRDYPAGDRAALLLERADRALYSAKAAGRDRVDSATVCACGR